MSLKLRLRLAIVALMTLLVVAMSVLYLYDFTHITFVSAQQRADLTADEVKGNLLDRLDYEMTQRGLRPGSLEEWKSNWTAIIQDTPGVTQMLRRTLANTELVSNILITDAGGKVLAASSPESVNKTLTPGEDFRELQNHNWIANLTDLLTRREDYTTIRSIGVGNTVLFRITVVIRSVLLKESVKAPLKNLALAFSAALFIAIFLGSVLPSLFLDPLQRLSERIDRIRTGEREGEVARTPRESREFADVQSKLNLLGEQYQGVRRDALELRTNVEQLLERLEEAVLLFDTGGRLMMAGETAQRMLGRARDEMVGRGVEDLFPPATEAGAVIGNPIRLRDSARDQPVTIVREDGAKVRLVASVQVLRRSPGGEDLGTLVTLRDVDSRRLLEQQLDLSSRLAAISRLTSGVAHEIKNPLNAMALHLEVLKGKVENGEPELDVISREIKRLDNVVKTFLNFNKPIELASRPVDLSDVVEQVLDLVSIDARSKQVEMDSNLKSKLWINGDTDLLKQAILNVVNNGLEAMGNGGKLVVRTDRNGDECQLTVTDAGSGIAPEVRDRIFNLYFTTKTQGTGIGLATTFRVVQLHSGTIDFVSEQGTGTTFRFRFPGMLNYQDETLSSATSGS